MRKLFLIFILFTLLLSRLQAAKIIIDSTTVINNQISPYIFGVNAAIWASIDSTMANRLKNAGITIIRWPGGGTSDGHDWYRNYWKAGNGNWYSGGSKRTSGYIDFCNMAQADPFITVNFRLSYEQVDSYWSNNYPQGIYTGGIPDGADFARDWLNYCNVDYNTTYGDNPAHGSSYNVKFWEIGNEPSMGGADKTNIYCNNFRDYYNAMTSIDPGIKIMGPSVHNYNVYDDWIPPFLDQCGDIVDIISIHRYYVAGPPNMETLLYQTDDWDSRIAAINSWITQYVVNKWGRSADEVEIAVTEWNTSWGNPGSSGSEWAHGLWTADILGQYMENNIYMGNFWHIQNGAQGMYDDGSPYNPRPAHYAFKFMKEHTYILDKLVKSTSDTSDLASYSSIRDNNNISLIVINKNKDQSINCNILLNPNIFINQNAVVYEQTSASSPSTNNINYADREFSYTFKKYSITCIEMTITSEIYRETITIPPEGKRVILPNGTTINCPSGSYHKPVTVELEYMFKPTLDNSILSNKAAFYFSISSSIEIANKLISFSLKYDDTNIDGFDESKFGVYYYNGVEWIKIDASVDILNNEIKFESNKLNVKYYIFEQDPNELETGKTPEKREVRKWEYNPFSPNNDGICDKTSIKLSLETDSLIEIKIYNRNYNLVRILIKEQKSKGNYYIEWDGRDDNNEIVSPGCYFYSVTFDKETKKGAIIVAY